MSGRRKKRSAPDLARLAALREIVREGTENRPGVYRMFAENGEVLYVGKSKAVRTRLLSYFRSEWPQDKGARLIADAHRVDWEYVPSEFAALLRELALIKKLRPRHNVMQKRAASLRDKLHRLESLREAFSHLRFAVEELTFAYSVPVHAMGVRDQACAFVLRPLAAEV